MTTLHLRKSIGRSPWRLGFLLVPLALALFALAPAPKAFGVVPPPDGGYPGFNTAEGTAALFKLTTGGGNTALGFNALYNDTSGSANTATGVHALFSNMTGRDNTASGNQALNSNATGSNNTATGYAALFSNTIGNNNTANGFEALFSNSTLSHGDSVRAGADNTAIGFQALYSNTGGTGNTANGFQALYHNSTGSQAVSSSSTGDSNTAIGNQALYSNTVSSFNTAIGVQAMYSTTVSDYLDAPPQTLGFNTAVGYEALYGNLDGAYNIALGASAGASLTTGNWNIDIGNGGAGGESNTIRIGEAAVDVGLGFLAGQSRTFIAGIRGVNTGNDDAVPVVIDSAGQLGTTSSSRRFKTEIKPMDKASEAILALKPVTFHYKSHKSDVTGGPQFGLIAEEVAKVNPELVVRDDNGKIYTVRYEAVNAMLLNEFLKEHSKVQEQEATIIQLKKDFQATAARQQKQIEVLTAGLQKVSAQVEVSKPAPQTVLNNQ